MDAKNLSTETALSERNNDGSKYSQSGVALQCNRNKTYQDIGSNPLAKTEPAAVRPCAVIGPDRVVPPPVNDAFLKKGSIEPWTCSDNMYPRPPDYPHKLSNGQNPSRNISPRQTFQENMQRIMVPPSYKTNEDSSYGHVQERSPILTKTAKPNMPMEGKYCEVPYAINPMTNEHKNLRDSDMCVPSVNSPQPRTAPHMWPAGSVNIHAPRAYGAHEIYQYPQYPSCAGPRPSVVPMLRSHRTFQDDPGYMYSDPYYQDANMRYKPYPPVKERYPQPRYDYISNYPNPFHPPPPFPTHKYEIPKAGQSHPYPLYPHLKYVDNRLPESSLEAYSRPNPPNYNIPLRNQVIHSNYASNIGTAQSKVLPYQTDSTGKPIIPNKGPYDNNNKVYIDYENSRSKQYPMSDTYFVNEISRVHPNKSQGMMPPNYPGVHPMTQQYYRKDMSHIKSHEFMPHFRNFDPTMNAYPMMRHQSQFSPNTLAISPTDSIASNDTIQTHGTNQEDCGYVSQSSTASIRSLDSGVSRLSSDYYKRHDYRYGHTMGNMQMPSKSDMNNSSKNKKQIDVRQFLQMWNEGDDDNAENNGTKEIIIQTGNSNNTNFKEGNQEQLYVLGLVNVPSEELDKYEHIQKVSKLPENIKGYNSIELLNQFEEAIESSKMNSFKSPHIKEFQMPLKENRHNIMPKQVVEIMPRPLSPLDVEAKISQSVIHKEVGCNFEIKPCSPKMLSVEVAAPIQNILGERIIEKVSNPLSNIIKSPIPSRIEENALCGNNNNNKDINLYDSPSCKMIKSPYSRNSTEPVKTNYSLQDLETNSGVCLASLPRLDNDIELNFPEVNQQFIDANKIEKELLQNNLQDSKESTMTPESINSKENHHEEEMQNKSLDTDASENEYMKLSKYRKIKGSSVDHSEENLKNNVLRTDSVIIKNPENKKYDDTKNIDFTLHLDNDNEIIPVNLTSEHNFDKSNTDLELFEHTNVIEPYSEDALDFSINKSEHINSNILLNNVEEKDNENLRVAPQHHENVQENSELKGENASIPNIEETLKEDNNTDVNSMETDMNLDEMLNSVADKVVPTIHNVEENMKEREGSECGENFTSVQKFSDIGDRKHEEFQNNMNDISETNTKNIPVTDFDSDLLTKNMNYFTEEETTNLNDSNNLESHVKLEVDCNTEIKQCVSNEGHDVECNKGHASENSNCESTESSSSENRNTEEHNVIIKRKSPETKLNEESQDFICSTSANLTDDDNSNIRDNSCQNNINNTDGNDIPTISAQNESLEDIKNYINESELPVNASMDVSLNNSETCVSETESTILNNNHLAHKKIHCRKFCKHLNSPWIQKLILHSEGLLSYPCDASNNKHDHHFDKKLEKEILNDLVSHIACEKSDVSTDEATSECDIAVRNTNNVEVLSTNEENNSTKEFLKSESKDYDDVTSEVDQNNDKVASGCNSPHDVILSKNSDEDLNIMSEKETNEAFAENLQDADDKEQEKHSDMPVVDEPKGNINDFDKNECPLNSNVSNIEDPVTEKNNEDVNDITSEAHNESIIQIYDFGSIDTIENINSVNKETNDEEDKTSKFIENEPFSPFKMEIEKSYINENITNDNSKSDAGPEAHENMELKEIDSKENENEEHLENIVNVKTLPNTRTSLKRSFSESDLSSYHDKENKTSQWPSKRKKIEENESFGHNIAENLCRLINNNRRNSISSIHNEDNVSFCILIEDNCIIAQESEDNKICFAEFTENCPTEIDSTIEDGGLMTQVMPSEDNNCDLADSIILECQNDKSNDGDQWVDDVACVETVVSEDIAEDVLISTSSTPEHEIIDFDESGVFCNSLTDKVKSIYGENMSDDDAQIVDTLYRTPQMDVNKTLDLKGNINCDANFGIYDDNESLEQMLSEPDNHDILLSNVTYNSEPLFTHADVSVSSHSKESITDYDITSFSVDEDSNILRKEELLDETKFEPYKETQVDTVHSCESSVDNVFNYKQKEDDTIYSSSSSPEVSSTTSEEKNSSILLKITNYNGSRVSEINEVKTVNKPRCKFTEKKDYSNSNFPNRPLLTKAAQKYIPPIKETVRDLKVKISLPQQSLLKLKQLKLSKSKPNIVNKQSSVVPIIPKKPKPNFEDVLKSIDEIQFKKHKEKSKKPKNTVPKVVIKKSENGSHYASTPSKETFNPDLTGRKWQPWVILEKNNFIDKMALRNKTRAIYSHRKNTYVLAEKFKKYKSVSSAKFVITQPKSSEPMGHLKYTIRLKHSY